MINRQGPLVPVLHPMTPAQEREEREAARARRNARRLGYVGAVVILCGLMNDCTASGRDAAALAALCPPGGLAP